MSLTREIDSIAEEKHTPLEECHYLWVGPPADLKTLHESKRSGVINHDIQEILIAAKQIKNPINFWCLREHVKHYIRLFRNKECKNIKVCSMEDFIDQCLESKNESITKAALAVSHEMKELFSEKRKAIKELIIRDRTTFKNIFAFFLLRTKGGYTLDSNIGFQEKLKILPSFTDFQYPYSERFCGNLLIECWALYSPANNTDKVGKILDIYLQKLKELRIQSEKEGYGVLFSSGACAIESMECVIPNKTNLTSEQAQWKGIDGITITALGLKKSYHGTHRSQSCMIAKYSTNVMEKEMDFFRERYLCEKDILATIDNLYDYNRYSRPSDNKYQYNPCLIHLQKVLIKIRGNISGEIKEDISLFKNDKEYHSAYHDEGKRFLDELLRIISKQYNKKQKTAEEEKTLLQLSTLYQEIKKNNFHIFPYSKASKILDHFIQNMSSEFFLLFNKDRRELIDLLKTLPDLNKIFNTTNIDCAQFLKAASMTNTYFFAKTIYPLVNHFSKTNARPLKNSR